MSKNQNFWSEIKFFKFEEFSCPCCGKNNIDLNFVSRLDMSRLIAGVPFVINSACRCVLHNSEVGGLDNSSHPLGLAVDIAAPSSQIRYDVLRSLLAVGFNRIGVYKTFIHVDIDVSKPQNIIYYK